jgi:hypothetical protein
MLGTTEILNYAFPAYVPIENTKLFKSGDLPDTANHFYMLVPLKDDSSFTAIKFGAVDMIAGGYMDGELFGKHNALIYPDMNTITVNTGAFIGYSFTKVV